MEGLLSIALLAVSLLLMYHEPELKKHWNRRKLYWKDFVKGWKRL